MPHDRRRAGHRGRPALAALQPAGRRQQRRPRRDRAGRGRLRLGHRGNRYLDGLAGLFVVNAGHGRKEIAAAAAAQAETLGYFPLWTYAHPPALALAARLADLAPADLNRVFFTTGGGEAVESAWKLARQYFVLIGQPERIKVIARRPPTTAPPSARSPSPGSTPIKEPFRPLLYGHTRHAPITNRSAARLRRREARARWPAPTRSSGSSSRRAPRPSPACSSSRCRTPAAASSPATATSSGSARSATAMACCSCPTR